MLGVSLANLDQINLMTYGMAGAYQGWVGPNGESHVSGCARQAARSRLAPVG